MKFMGQWRNFFFRDAKIEKKCQEEQIKKNPLSKRKNITNFLKILNENFILLCRKNSPELSKL